VKDNHNYPLDQMKMIKQKKEMEDVALKEKQKGVLLRKMI